MANAVVDILVQAKDAASDVMSQVAETGGEAAQSLADNWKEITVASGAAGAAAEGYARSQAPLTEGTERLANATDMTSGEIRDMATEMSDATFPLEDAIGLMETGRQQGIESAEGLREYASFWDTVGDATGENSEMLAEGSAALRAIGIDAGNEAEALDAFGYITQETSGNVSEFMNFVDRAGPELREMGMDVDDTAGVLGALEHELGMSGRTARTEFRQAVNEADGDMDQLLDTLGLSEEQLAEYTGAVSESGDVIGDNADIHADARTPLEEFQASVQDLMYRFGPLADAAGMAAPALMALGPAIKGASVAARGAVVAKGALAVAVGAISAPVLAVVAAVAALAAGVVYAWRNSETFRNVVTAVWERVRDVVVDTVSAVVEWFRNMTERAREIWETIREGVDLGEIFNTIRDTVQALWNGIQAGIDIVTSVFDRVRSVLSGASDRFEGLGGVWERIQDIAQAVFGDILDIVTGAIEGVQSVIEAVGSRIESFWDRWGDTILAVAEAVWSAVEAVVSTVMDAIQAVIDAVLPHIESVWDSTFNAILGVAEGIWNAIVGVIEGALDVIMGVWDVFAGALTGDWDRVWSGIQSVAEGIWNAISSLIEGALTAIQSVITGTMDAISSAWSGALEGMSAFASSIWDSITGAISGAIDNVRTTISDGISSARDAFSDGVSNVVSTATELPGRIMDALGDMVSRFASVGSDIISGIVNGVRNAASRLFSTVRDIAGDALDSAMSALGIGSPSRLFADEVGGPIMEGLAEGIRTSDEMERALDELDDQADGPNLAANVSSLDSAGSEGDARDDEIRLLEKLIKINERILQEGKGETVNNFEIDGSSDPEETAQQVFDRMRRMEVLNGRG